MMDDIKNDEKTVAEKAAEADATVEAPLSEIVKNTVLEAEAEKKAMPAPETARLTYSAYADMKPCPTSVYAPMNEWGYALMLVLCSIPVLGLVISIIFAAAAKKLARRQLALSFIIINALFIAVLGIAALVCVLALKIDLLVHLRQLLTYLEGLFGSWASLIK